MPGTGSGPTAPTAIAVAAVCVALVALVPSSARSASDDFYGLMHEAMERMHTGMNVSPSDDVDRDFAAMMIPHHQGAIDMAILELRYGRDKRLRRLAQSIIVDQGQEIKVMRSILDEMSAKTGEK